MVKFTSKRYANTQLPLLAWYHPTRQSRSKEARCKKNEANPRNSSDKCCSRVAQKCKGEQNWPQPSGQPSKMQLGENAYISQLEI